MQTTLTNKQVSVYFDDKSSSGVTRKDGEFLQIENNAIYIKNTGGTVEIIPLYRVIRIVEKWRG